MPCCLKLCFGFLPLVHVVLMVITACTMGPRCVSDSVDGLKPSEAVSHELTAAQRRAGRKSNTSGDTGENIHNNRCGSQKQTTAGECSD